MGQIPSIYASRRSKFQLILIALIMASASILASGCGKKGLPGVKSYDRPQAPSSLTGFIREGQAYITWSYPADKEILLKQIIILKDQGEGFIQRAQAAPAERTFLDSGLSSGNTYRYKVLAQSSRDAYSSDSNVLTLTALEVLPAPSGLVFKASATTVDLQWNSMSTGILYNVYKSDKAGNFSFTPVNALPLAKPSFSDSIDTSKTAYYTVRALHDSAVRNEGLSSEMLDVNAARFIPPVLTGVRWFSSDSRVFISWEQPAESWITSFRIYRKTAGKAYSLVGDTQTPAFIDTLSGDGIRDYRVHAVGPVVEGPGTEIRGVMPDIQK